MHVIPFKCKLSDPTLQGCTLVAQYAAGHPAEPKSVVIFIHGFRGDPEATWVNYPSLVQGPYSTQFANADLFYFGYDSLYTSASFSGGQLYTLLNNIVGQPSAFMQQAMGTTLERLSNFEYAKVVIVAHSLGAIVSRYALLQAGAAGQPWCNNARLLLFAPAHTGASLAPLVRATFSPIAGFPILWGLAEYNIVTLADLTPGSPCLTQLASMTTAALPLQPFHTAHTVVQAQYEKVVSQTMFCGDPFPILAPGRNHVNVCKPDQTYYQPIQLLQGMI